MHALILAAGSAGDVHPFVAIGRALRARGHDVAVLANDHFEQLVRGAGLGFVSGGSAAEFTRVTENPDLWHPRKGLKFDNASRLEDLGVGRMLPMNRYRAARGAALLDRLLADEAVRAACARARYRMATGAPLEETVALIEKLA